MWPIVKIGSRTEDSYLKSISNDVLIVRQFLILDVDQDFRRIYFTFLRAMVSSQIVLYAQVEWHGGGIRLLPGLDNQ